MLLRHCEDCESLASEVRALSCTERDLRAQLAAMTKERDAYAALFRDADATAQSQVDMVSVALARTEKAEAERDGYRETAIEADAHRALWIERCQKAEAELARAQVRLADVEEVAQLARDVCVDLVRLDELETALGYGPDRDADRWVYTPPHASEHAGEVVTVLGRGYHKDTHGLMASGEWVETVRYIDAEGTHRSRPVDDFNKLFVNKVKA